MIPCASSSDPKDKYGDAEQGRPSHPHIRASAQRRQVRRQRRREEFKAPACLLTFDNGVTYTSIKQKHAVPVYRVCDLTGVVEVFVCTPTVEDKEEEDARREPVNWGGNLVPLEECFVIRPEEDVFAGATRARVLRTATLRCNKCGEVSIGITWRSVGSACPRCHTFNTRYID